MRIGLTAEQITQLQRWMQAHWAPPPPCAECGAVAWAVPKHIETITLIDAAHTPATQRNLWVVILACRSCRRLALLPAAGVGIAPR
jgi:hypothetical protein